MRDTHHEPASGHFVGAPGVPSGWAPLVAFRLHTLYAPVIHALAALRAAGASPSMRVLEAGGFPGVLTALLARQERWGAECHVTALPAASDADDALASLDVQAFDYVVAVDWLPWIAPSRREQQVAALCRTARGGVVLLNAFDAPEVIAMQRTVNQGYRLAHGKDHPKLGRLLELGLPDLATTRRWIEPSFSSMDTRPVEQLALWQMVETMATLDADALRAPTPADIAAAALYPLPIELAMGEPSYRTLLVCGARPFELAAPHPSPRNDIPVAAMLGALEAGEQRRALAQLTQAITVGREREREEFRASVASLAAELRELEAQTDALALDARERERTLANLQVVARQAEIRAGEESNHADLAETHARNMTALQAAADARADAAHTHARNLDALRQEAARLAAAAQTRAEAAETHARNFEAMRDEAEARARAAELRMHEVTAVLGATQIHAQNLDALRLEAERRDAIARARTEAAETHARNFAALRDEALARAEAHEVRTRERGTLLDAAETHARNLDSLRADAERRAATFAARLEAAEARAEAAEARARELETVGAATRTHVRNLDALRVRAEEALDAFARSRAGRAQALYRRARRTLTGRE